ncbi:polysaccharide deacetylase family protein [Segetibacter sp.]|jgi:peptidoglycan/xylan/chitin deacetylase (PgdA/CDA1 family)|uniref:polysaccharide deacetylase family protein n=1 Tax=Segetibacter sp. TaxID=2231182 RepID=UPI0026148657|nr:polysaccharide deacetylase family protein [Segetibacter sp.]MCW3081049.1 Nodulation protein [Segetibacter sp.]
MYREEPYTGKELPYKSLCLTYDDGPGKDTYEIARFLFDENIQATFFVVGKYAIENEETLEKVARLGHIIGNHTYEHPDMPYYLSRNGDIQNQVLRTDALIKKYNKKNTIYFRSPYGKWSKEVANNLNLNLLTNIDHVGPINWDIAGIDCFYWKKDVSIEKTAEKYLNDIEEKGRGIVVMHDEIADMNFLQPKNKTLELTRQIIPKLKAKGYKFVRLDEIQSIKEDAAKKLTVTLKTTFGKYLCIAGDSTIKVEQKNSNLNREFYIEDMLTGCFALSGADGRFLSIGAGEGNVVKLNAKQVTSTEKFDLVPLRSNKFLLRADNGHFLQIQKESGILTATAAYMRGGEIFTILPIGLKEREKFSLKEEIKSLQRQLLYVKSKVKERISR